MTTVFYTWLYDRFIEIKGNLKRQTNFIEIISPILSEPVLAIEIM